MMKRRLLLLGVLAAMLVGACLMGVQAEGDFSYRGDTGGISITGYTGESSEMIIPNQIDGQPVVSIAKEAFMNNGRIVKAVLPEGLVRIGAAAFQGAKYLEEITLPVSLKSIEQAAFNSCGSLTSIAIPEGVRTVEKDTFLNCKKLSQVSLPQSLESIGEKAFAVTGLTEVDFPSGLQSIGNHAFYGSKNLAEVILPNGLKNIDEYAFFVCNSLKKVVLPTSLQAMAAGVFDKCPNLESIAIPMTVTNIRSDALFSSNLIPQKLTILTPAGSAAEKYALQAGIAVQPAAKAESVSMVMDGSEMLEKNLAIDLSGDDRTLDVQASTSPETLWPGVVWHSSNDQVARVDNNGHVTALKKGETVISAIAADGSGARSSFTLNVANLAKSVEISGSDALYSLGKTSLKAIVLPESADNRTVDWTSSDPAVVSVTGKGLVKAEMVGQKQTVVVTATARDGSGVAASHELTVFPLVEEARLLKDGQPLENKATLRIDLGADDRSIQLQVDNQPADAMQQMKWESSSKRVAEVDENGKITGLKKGKAVITASTVDGTRKKITLNVIVSTQVQNIMISGSSSIASEQKMKLSAVVLPEDATDKKLLWSSSDESLARVNKNTGEVTARKAERAQTVVIGAEALDGSGKTAQIEITVHPAAAEVLLLRDGLTLDRKTTLELSLSETPELNLTASVLPEDAIQNLSWKSSDERVAKVDEMGNISLLKKGNVKITVSAKDGSKVKATLNLAVIP